MRHWQFLMRRHPLSLFEADEQLRRAERAFKSNPDDDDARRNYIRLAVRTGHDIKDMRPHINRFLAAYAADRPDDHDAHTRNRRESYNDLIRTRNATHAAAETFGMPAGSYLPKGANQRAHVNQLARLHRGSVSTITAETAAAIGLPFTSKRSSTGEHFLPDAKADFRSREDADGFAKSLRHHDYHHSEVRAYSLLHHDVHFGFREK